jgi:hypothetical protein
MPVTPQATAGKASATIGRRRKRRRLREVSGEYEQARIKEIKNRTELVKFKLSKLRESLLDRAMLRGELTALFAAIRTIISAYPFSEREKADCFRNLPPVDDLLERVAWMQRQSEGFDGNGKTTNSEED